MPEALLPYREAWLQTFRGTFRLAGVDELRRAAAAGRPLLVGDFHPAPRARRYLAQLLEQAEFAARPGLMLELLPQPVVMTAEAALRHPDLRLIDGRLCAEAFREVLRALAARGGLVAGAWVEGNATERDAAAAARWAALQAGDPDVAWTLFFGDWHLADPHLPARLRAAGGAPRIVHQSPEPLWIRRRRRREEVLDLGDGHWAWLHTPPLSHWASALVGLEAQPEPLAEISEHLVEALAIHLAEALQVPEPAGRPCVWSAGRWREFHETLPAQERRALSADPPPRAAVLHPNLPAVWLPDAPDLNLLVEMAAHQLACEFPLGRRADFGGRLRSRVFRRTVAAHLNPFLRPLEFTTVAALLFPGRPDPRHGAELARLLEALESGREPRLGARLRLVAVEVLGTRAGSRLAVEERVDHAFFQEFLRSGGESFSLPDLAATIRAA